MTPLAFSAPGRFFRGNLHTHSTVSDGKLEPDEVCRRYAAMGYDFICLSDHFLGEYGFPIADARPYRIDRFTTLLGAEVHTGAIACGDPWHILAVGLPSDFAPTRDDESGPDLAARCAEAGALVAVAHPQWYQLQPEEAAAIEAAHAIEIYNHSCAVHHTREDGTYVLDALLNGGKRVNAIASDDAHFLTPGHENADAFGGWVMVKAEANEPEALLAALKTGAFYASTGPELHDIAIDGSQVHVSCSAALTIIALGRGSNSINSHSPGQTRASLDISKFAGDWMRIVVVDRDGRRAWSNPIWLD